MENSREIIQKGDFMEEIKVNIGTFGIIINEEVIAPQNRANEKKPRVH